MDQKSEEREINEFKSYFNEGKYFKFKDCIIFTLLKILFCINCILLIMRSFCLKFVYFIIFFLIHIIKIFQKRKKSIFKIYKNSQRNYKKKTKQIQRKKKGFLASVLS